MDKSKYWWQRLTAKEVLQLYAAGERDFRGAILTRCNFRRADLSGADFSKANIRGARFVEATLEGTRFCHAEAGRPFLWGIVELLIALVVIPCGFFQAVASFFIVHIGLFFASPFAEPMGREFNIIANSVAVILVTSLVVIGARVVTGAGAAVTAAAVSIVTAPFAGFLAGILAVLQLGRDHNPYAAFLAGFAAVIAGAIAIAIVNCRLSRYVERRMRQGDPTFEKLGSLFVLGGTAFNGANLTEASFANATLGRTNFANSRHGPTVLTRVRWQNAQQLDWTHFGTNNLRDPRVRYLLTRLNHPGLNGRTPLDLSEADLQGSNLAGAKLHRINLRWANLNGATLAGAELQGANLTNAQCLGTDFTAAHLTGACLQTWQIDNTTILQDVDCQYVF